MSELLKELCDLSGTSGGEQGVAEFILSKMMPHCDKVFKDGMGNLYGYSYGTSPDAKTIALCSHMDEVGLIISSVTEDGYLKFKCLGGIDARVLLAKRVRIGKNNILGVIGVKAIHLIPKEERGKTISYDKMYIDIGATNKEEALKQVDVGDMAVFDTKADSLGTLFKAKALDDRAGCYVLLELMKRKYSDTVCYCFTVQEETGLRGASVAARRIGADACVVVECTSCMDLPEVAEHKISTRVGKGPAISIADYHSYANPDVRKALEECGEEFQYKNVTTGGNDAGQIHLNNIKTASLSVPCRYLHSPVGVISPVDLQGAVKHLDNFLKERERLLMLDEREEKR